MSADRVLTEVLAERARQDAKWGEPDVPDGTGLAYSVSAHDAAVRARREVLDATRAGRLTWRHVLAEEVAEVLAQDDPAKLRAELVRLAALAVWWAEAIDRRSARRQTCSKCDGCGRIADDEDGTPWTFWENLPLKNAAAVVLGLVRPITCPKCDGTGEVVL